MQVSVLLLRWGSYCWACNLWVLIIYFSFLLRCPLCFQGSPQTQQRECFLVFGNFSLFKTPFLGLSSLPTSFVSFFVFYIFFLFSKTMSCFSGCLMSSATEVVLWNLLSVEMFFWWICGGESDLPILFLRHLRTAPTLCLWALLGHPSSKPNQWVKSKNCIHFPDKEAEIQRLRCLPKHVTKPTWL